MGENEEFHKGDKVMAYVEYVNSWVEGEFMFYYNELRAYVKLDKLIIPVIEGVLYTSEPVIELDLIKSYKNLSKNS